MQLRGRGRTGRAGEVAARGWHRNNRCLHATRTSRPAAAPAIAKYSHSRLGNELHGLQAVLRVLHAVVEYRQGGQLQKQLVVVVAAGDLVSLEDLFHPHQSPVQRVGEVGLHARREAPGVVHGEREGQHAPHERVLGLYSREHGLLELGEERVEVAHCGRGEGGGEGIRDGATVLVLEERGVLRWAKYLLSTRRLSISLRIPRQQSTAAMKHLPLLPPTPASLTANPPNRNPSKSHPSHPHHLSLASLGLGVQLGEPQHVIELLRR